MRYTQIGLSLTFLCLWSTIQAGERPPQAPPIDERLTGIESRLDNHENRINALEGKTALACPCPDGPCICQPGECECPNCPEHPKKAGPVVWLGKPRSNGRSAVLVCSDDCGPCQRNKSSLTGSAANIRIENYSTLEQAGRAGYPVLPYAKLMQDGEVVLLLRGGAAKPERIREWLEGEKSAPRQVSRPVTFRQTYFRPQFRFSACGPGGCR